jgi:hypothetical protein
MTFCGVRTVFGDNSALDEANVAGEGEARCLSIV